MKSRIAIGGALSSAALFAPVHAKKPVAADEAAVREIIAYVYESYSLSNEDITEPVENAPMPISRLTQKRLAHRLRAGPA